MPVLCPTCNVALEAARTPYGLGWLCLRCQGRAANLSVMRRALRQPFMREVWRQARDNSRHALMAASMRCPSCRQGMRTVTVAGEENTGVVLDVCPFCQMAWMAAEEIAALPRQAPTEPLLNPKTRELLAMAEVEARRDAARREQSWAAPEQWWRTALTLFGFPVEEGAPPLLRRPWVTWALAAGMIAATAWRLLSAEPETVGLRWGLLPSDPFRHGGLDWLTSFFLHGGVWHLVGNVYFLLIFGDNVEDLLGRWRYLGLIFLADVAANAAHLLIDTRVDIPLVGASGGISGILIFYALTLPRVRLVFSLWGLSWVSAMLLGAGWGWFRLSARWALAAWIAWQFVGVWSQLAGFSHVSALAHLGGAVAGAAAWWWWRAALNPILEPTGGWR